MRKMALVLVFVIMVSLTQTCLAYGFVDSDVPMTIALNYLKWASDCFGVEDLQIEFDIYLDGDDGYTIVDDIIIVDNRKDKVIQYIKLNYFNVGKDEPQQALRAMSLFASIEYGELGDWTDPATLQAIADGYSFTSALNTALLEHTEKLADGKAIPFYVSDRFTYVLTASIEAGIVITVA